MKQSSFESLGSLPATYAKGRYIHSQDGTIASQPVERVAALLCRHCGQGVVVVEAQFIGGIHHATSGLKGGAVTWRGFHWWPLPESTTTPDIPSDIARAFDEAVRSLAARCPQAAAVMARRTLEAVADEQSAEGKTLEQRLKKLAASGALHPTFSEWAGEVRLVGNQGAHFDPIKEVSSADAQELVKFVRDLLRHLYELPAELRRRRSHASP